MDAVQALIALAPPFIDPVSIMEAVCFYEWSSLAERHSGALLMRNQYKEHILLTVRYVPYADFSVFDFGCT